VIESLIPLIGDVVAGRYRLERAIGQGGMGLVYQARDLELERDVALKVLLPEVAARPDAHKRFEREAKVAAAFQHAHAVRILDYGQDGARLYLAMEMLHGETLQARLARKGFLAVDEIARLGVQIAGVLDAAHQAGLVHRDIKPANLFIETRPRDEPRGEEAGERVIILDFGLAFLQNPGTEPGNSIMGRLTQDGHAGGTPAYMSPEQACGVDPGPPSDVYAFGCVLFEMVAGRPPFISGGVGKVLSEHIYVTPPELRHVRADTPGSLAELVARMMQKQPGNRPRPAEICRRLAGLTMPNGDGGSDGGDEHQRTHDLASLGSRSDRMVTVPVSPGQPGLADADSVRMALDGPLDDELRVALQANGVVTLDTSSDMAGHERAIDRADIVFAAHDRAERLRALVEHGRPVIAATDSMDGMAALLRIGVADVVLHPIRADDLARKIKRTLRRHRRRAE
jgi:eukaryotic-like serine/threonine-protein kinase